MPPVERTTPRPAVFGSQPCKRPLAPYRPALANALGRCEVAVALVAALLACAAYAFAVGPSWTWDRAHYHEYAGRAWLAGGPGDGLLPSGGQGLLNPLGYVPRALLATAGWGELGVALATAVFQGLAVWFVWLAARDRSGDPAVHGPAALLAFLTPVFLLQLGTSHLDASTGVLVLLGVWACRRAADPGRSAPAWVLLGGLAMGAATGLKLSNAIAAALAPILFLALARGADGALRPLRALATPLAYAAGGLAGLLITGGTWAAALYTRYGNPFYPAFDGLFNPSPALADAAVGAEPSLAARIAGIVRISGGRFVPQDLGEWLSFPWRVADPTLPANLAYLEWHAPDPRLATALVLAIALVGLRLARAVAPALPGRSPSPVDARLAAFVVAGCGLWAASSANGRYGVALLMIASVPIVQAIHALFRPGVARRAALTALVSVHAAWGLAMPDRADQSTGTRWEDATLRADMPPALRDTPTLHVVTTLFSWSDLLPRFGPGSALLNLPAMCRGERCPPDLGPERARALLDAWSGRIRTLVAADRYGTGRGWISDDLRGSVDGYLAELDLRIEPTGCVPFEVSPMLYDGKMVESTDGGLTYLKTRFVVSCPVIRDPEEAARIRARRDRQDAVFALLERSCPAALGGSVAPTRWVRDGVWHREFPTRDISVWIRDGRVGTQRLQRSERDLGTVAEVLGGWTPDRCDRFVWPTDDRAATREQSSF
jgi:hypothetical protein